MRLILSQKPADDMNTEVRMVRIDGREYPVTISDSQTALSQAAAGGGAVLGVLNPQEPWTSLSSAPYVVEAGVIIRPEFLEQVVRRHMGLPWNICSSSRLSVREFTKEDYPRIEQLDFQPFPDEEWLCTYIKSQYHFYEYGLWAVILKESGALIGQAGVWDMELPEGTSVSKEELLPLELGYQIYRPCRRQGYGEEACRAILTYCAKEDSLAGRPIYIKTDPSNEGSARIAQKLGFRNTASGLWLFTG